jgi:uncharacterized membrane protein YkvI
MKRLDWFIVSLLILIGLTCLTMSATSMMDTDAARSYFNEMLQMCLWIGIPVVSVGIIYYILKRKSGGS